ncbi:hypothetical protein Cgig2_004500 [Carnegiea gigantea]|uniref:Uncharacterized protein n=1 Tax=Carnegiea gigantea TaxID=171969 RepID=A0A9Q1Q8Z3_9CARY|nr:hypothetical protein Cgig2_004500 [Carnegiea gigantea]
MSKPQNGSFLLITLEINSFYCSPLPPLLPLPKFEPPPALISLLCGLLLSLCYHSVLFLLNPHLGHSFILLEIAHSTVTKKVSSTNPSNRTRASIDLLLARGLMNVCIIAMIIMDMITSIVIMLCFMRLTIYGTQTLEVQLVHIHVIDKPLQGLTLPLVTYNFVNENEVIDQNNNLFEPSLTTNIERVGKTNMTFASQTPIELPPTRKQLIQRSLFTSKQNGDVSTPTNGRDGSTTPTGKNSAKVKFVAPGFLCCGRLLGLKKPSCPKSSIGQSPSDQHLINALEGTSQDEAKANAAKKNVVNLIPFTIHDILQAHSDKEKGCENSVSNDALISDGKLTRKLLIHLRMILRIMKGGKDGKVPNIAEIFKATRKRKDGTLNDEDASLYLEASHQKKISDIEASHQRDIGELLKEIKLLKNVVLPQQHITTTPSSAP